MPKTLFDFVWSHSLFRFNRIFISLADNLDRHTISNDFEFRPDRTIDFGVTCPLVPKNKNHKMRSFKSNENIHKKEGGSNYVVSANKASSVTL